MSRRMLIKQASIETGLSQHELRKGMKEGRYPHTMAGNRYIVDIDLLEETLKNMAMQSIKTGSTRNNSYGKLRRVD